MILTTVNDRRQLLYMTFMGNVTASDLTDREPELDELTKNLRPGFRLMTDFGGVESFAEECAPLIGRVMENFDRKGIGLIVRVIPEPRYDIGMNILALFHYPHHPTMVTCKTLAEAGGKLGL